MSRPPQPGTSGDPRFWYGPHPAPSAPPGQPVGPPPYGYWHVPQAGTNGLAVASLVLGIIWMYWIGSVLALVFGYIAKAQIRRSGQQGAGLATAGIVLGWIGVFFLVCFVFLIVVAVANSSGTRYDGATSRYL